MARVNQAAFPTIKTEGGLLPPDFLARVRDLHGDVDGLAPTDYNLAPDERLNEEINDAWNHLTKVWDVFSGGIDDTQPEESQPGAGATRQSWLLPLFRRLDYGRLQTAQTIRMDDEGEGGKEYPISHGWEGLPIHLVGWNADLDRTTAGARGAARISPHGLMQELLNRSPDHLWGIVANGKTLRLMRDNISLTRQAYVEFDLAEMMNGQVYADFQLLWLLCHQSRFEGEQPSGWRMERWKENGQQQGARAREGLREGVHKTIASLGAGFLKAPNTALKARLRSGELTTQDYYRQLLRLVYRLIFLFVAEERDLLHPPLAEGDPEADPKVQRKHDRQMNERERYAKHYSTGRLRTLAERPRGTQHVDLWRGLCFVMAKLHVDGCEPLALPALGSFLWDGTTIPDLTGADIPNRDLLVAVRHLSYVTDQHGTIRIDYKNMGSEELGSVYESLLELHPDMNVDTGRFVLDSAAGHERKTTGSYYTPDSLVQLLLDSSLDPVMDAAVKGKTRQDAKQALLDLKVCDPASGSGHFLIAATHRIAARLASIVSGEEEASPAFYQSAIREVVRNCIYGVDRNEFAVELCKVSLWMEALDPGKPLNFLDHRIRHGDSLVGVIDPSIVEDLIPNDAYSAVTGDDKEVARGIKARNQATLKAHKPGQALIRFASGADADVFTEAEEDTVEQVRAKAELYQEWLEEDHRRREVTALHLWTAAFFVPLTEGNQGRVPTSATLIDLATNVPISNIQEAVDAANECADRLAFFHWKIEFPDVYTPGHDGFDVVLSNPPWGHLKLQEKEFFAGRDVQIATAPNKAARERLIQALREASERGVRDPRAVAFADEYDAARHDADAMSLFARRSGRFPMCGVGDINTYALFSEHMQSLLGSHGRASMIVPSGISTDKTTSAFFRQLVEDAKLVSLLGFINEELLFPAVLHNFKFCVVTIASASHDGASADYAFLCHNLTHAHDEQRHFRLSASDFATLNPNTGTCPVFRTHADSELTKGMYTAQRSELLYSRDQSHNPWSVRFFTMFHMANDSHLFATERGEGWLQLYEGKMIHGYDHRYASFPGRRVHMLPKTTREQHEDWSYTGRPHYYVQASDVERVLHQWRRPWTMALRSIASSGLDRTLACAVLPRVGAGHNLVLLRFADAVPTHLSAALLANLNTIVFDYVARQKIGGSNLSHHVLEQLPVISPGALSENAVEYIVTRVVELVYTCWDVCSFVSDLLEYGPDELVEAVVAQHARSGARTDAHDEAADRGAPFPPFAWDESRRAVLRAELDAYYAQLYGLTRDQLRYILDPSDVYGDDFPGETFRVLKDREMREFGEYRTQRLVLDAWDRQQSGGI